MGSVAQQIRDDLPELIGVGLNDKGVRLERHRTLEPVGIVQTIEDFADEFAQIHGPLVRRLGPLYTARFQRQ